MTFRLFAFIPQVVYYDGQMDDARLNVALATTASGAGATVLNYVSVVSLLKACTAVVGRFPWRRHRAPALAPPVFHARSSGGLSAVA